jgi:hypothetical protein
MPVEDRSALPMPSTKKTGTKAAPKPQTEDQSTAQTPTPEAAPAAPEPTPTPAADPTSMFDDAPPEPPVAEQPAVESAAPSEPSAEDRPEGIDGEQEATPPAAPEPDAPPADTEEPTEPTQGDDQQQQPDAPAADDAKDQDEEKPEEQPKSEEPSSVAPTEVRFGQVVGLLHRMPLGDVLAYADTFAEKIEAMTYSAAVQALQPRMRVSEGRCAPVYFTINDDFEPEHLIAGDDALSAAKAIGLEQVFVVLIYPEDAGAIQSYLASKAGADAPSTEDEELVWRSQGYHADN